MIPKRNGNGEVVFTSGDLKKWIALITGVIAIVVTIAGVGGFIANDVAAQQMLDYRITEIENDYTTGTDADIQFTNIHDRLDRIENKLDQQLQSQRELESKIDGYVESQEEIQNLIVTYLASQSRS